VREGEAAEGGERGFKLTEITASDLWKSISGVRQGRQKSELRERDHIFLMRDEEQKVEKRAAKLFGLEQVNSITGSQNDGFVM
jgi:hypothetical protein